MTGGFSRSFHYSGEDDQTGTFTRMSDSGSQTTEYKHWSDCESALCSLRLNVGVRSESDQLNESVYECRTRFDSCETAGPEPGDSLEFRMESTFHLRTSVTLVSQIRAAHRWLFSF